jgi:hypothetical protein
VILIDDKGSRLTLVNSCPVTEICPRLSVESATDWPILYLEKKLFSYLKRQYADFEELVAESESVSDVA